MAVNFPNNTPFFNLDSNFIGDYKLHYSNENHDTQFDNDIIQRPVTLGNQIDHICNSESMRTAVTHIKTAFHSQSDPILDIITFTESTNNQIIGFVCVKKMISQCSIGETRKPIISIEAICTNTQNVRSRLGHFLLGFTIYTALYRGLTLILQVDQSYNNMIAYCLYQRFGFEIDTALIPGCYSFNNIDRVKLVMKLKNTVTVANMFNDNRKDTCRASAAAAAAPAAAAPAPAAPAAVPQNNEKMKDYIFATYARRGLFPTDSGPGKAKEKKELLKNLPPHILHRIVDDPVVFEAMLSQTSVLDAMMTKLNEIRDLPYDFIEGGKSKKSKTKNIKIKRSKSILRK